MQISTELSRPSSSSSETQVGQNLFGSRICLIHDLAHSYLVRLDTRKWTGKWFKLKRA
ncbi:hypothetical protein HanRHA438_Chr13g0626581 [Helianthus annuus]|nr:hypothetical protein HanRHA438_Chr13g0626581 [Helianthus annuus]